VAHRYTIATQAELVAYLQDWKRLIDSPRFSSKSEKASRDQFPLFNEAEVEAAAAEDDLEEDTIAVPAHARKRRGRRSPPELLPVKEILHDLSDDEKVCRHDPSHPLVEIGRETSDQLELIPRPRSRSFTTCDPRTRTGAARKGSRSGRRRGPRSRRAWPRHRCSPR